MVINPSMIPSYIYIKYMIKNICQITNILILARRSNEKLESRNLNSRNRLPQLNRQPQNNSKENLYDSEG